MNDNIKMMTVRGSAIALALAIGLQTFIFGHNDMQAIKEKVEQLAERLTQLETTKSDD